MQQGRDGRVGEHMTMPMWMTAKKDDEGNTYLVINPLLLKIIIILLFLILLGVSFNIFMDFKIRYWLIIRGF
jgi:putative effector of murein hydrolase